MAISTDNALDAKNMAESVKAGFYVLADDDASVARAYNVFDLHGDGVASPATFILNHDGEVVAYHVAHDITARPTAEAILTQLDRIPDRRAQ